MLNSIISTISKPILLSAITLSLFAQPAYAAQTNVNVPFETLSNDSNLYHPQRGVRVITRQSYLNWTWNLLQVKQNNKTAAPKINFTNDAVIGVFAGTQDEAGHTLRIKSITSTPQELVVLVEERIPADNCKPQKTVSHPHDIVKIKRVPLQKRAYRLEQHFVSCNGASDVVVHKNFDGSAVTPTPTVTTTATATTSPQPSASPSVQVSATPSALPTASAFPCIAFKHYGFCPSPAASVSPTATPAVQNLSFTTIAQNSNEFYHPLRRFRVIKTQPDWAKLWGELRATRAVPAVDFNNQMVIGVFDGARNTGGYSVNITSIKEYSDHITVYAQMTQPGAACMVTQAITHPAHIVNVKQSSKPVYFTLSVKTNTCLYAQ